MTDQTATPIRGKSRKLCAKLGAITDVAAAIIFALLAEPGSVRKRHPSSHLRAVATVVNMTERLMVGFELRFQRAWENAGAKSAIRSQQWVHTNISHPERPRRTTRPRRARSSMNRRRPSSPRRRAAHRRTRRAPTRVATEGGDERGGVEAASSVRTPALKPVSNARGERRGRGRARPSMTYDLGDWMSVHPRAASVACTTRRSSANAPQRTGQRKGGGNGQADAKRRYPSSWNVAHPDRTAGTSARGRPLDRVISDSSGSSQILLRFVTSPREVHTGVIG